MASDFKMSGDGKDTVQENESLELEKSFEAAEAKLLKLSLHEGSGDSEITKTSNASPLVQETVWLKQQQYESAETLYYMFLNGTAVTTGKRHHGQNNRAQSKKQKHDLKANPEFCNKKFKSAGASLSKTAKTIQTRLEDLEKIQQQKSQVIKDATSRLVAAVEECQSKLIDDLAQSAGQINVFRSLLSEIEAVIDKTTDSVADNKLGHYRTQERYCRKVSDRFSKLGKDLNSCFSLCNSFQAEVSKSDINRIVGDISKLTLVRKNWDSNMFVKRKDVIAENIKSLLAAGDDDDDNTTHPSDSDSSLEGSCSVSDSENGTGKQSKAQSGRASKAKKTNANSKQLQMKTNRNNANIMQVGRNKAKSDFATGRPHSGQNAPGSAVKRNALGVQNSVDKRSDLFQFRGVSRPLTVPFLSQPGLLGIRPNVHHMQGANLQSQFRFSPFMTGGQKQQLLSNFGTAHNPMSAGSQSGFGNMNFNFSGSQSRSSPLEFAKNSMNQQARSNIRGQGKQPKLFQAQQDQTKGAKKSGAKPGVAYPHQQRAGGNAFSQNSHTGLLGSYPLRGNERGSLEQQLNEMAQKIQQMQLSTSHNFQLQQLMRETERLRQLVAQKQHQHQQQDRFQQQFQLLINSFMQQQRQQQFQGPQSKMARAVQFQNPQKQQQHNRQLQQQKKRKQQQNKVQQVKQEPQKQQSPEKDTETEKAKQESASKSAGEKLLQNGEDRITPKVEKNIIGKNSKVTKLGTFSPQAQGDKLKAGISSIVVMEHISCVIVVDIINSCLKLYHVGKNESGTTGLSHQLATRLELSRPYYMGKLSKDMIVVSREGKLLSLVKVSKNRLEFIHDIRTESQYYGLGYVADNVIVCAAFADNRIDLLSVQDGVAQTAELLTQCKGPELVAAVPSTGSILYLERVLNETVHLLGISQQSVVEFSIDLESDLTDVWSVASISDRIVCCNKQSGKVKLFTKDGVFLADVIFPPGTVNQPFAMTFCDSGHMYIANDGAWDGEYEHYITTDINVYSFS